ncbi:hypothetical protein Klosneuvirus_1_284 [Klosneuvirus KNV1]|uniref:t-SNARE coiled-coil homology domain-containing protein n=1 Tax=Klosneuvirus KNV1 TaxID=1977640 RepID=A0A1V0SI88_9VIRU|nr:hypothetical protein Klosneuvirus_1_284 [Klosneuvirus KNV1]
MNDKIEVINESNDDIQLVRLNSLDIKVFEGDELDKQLINERDEEMIKLAAELNALLDSIHQVNEMIHQDSEKIEKVVENTEKIDVQVTVATDILEETVPMLKALKEKYLALKIAGGSISTSLVLGGVGFFAGGPVGAAIGAPVGAGLGALGGWLTKFI